MDEKRTTLLIPKHFLKHLHGLPTENKSTYLHICASYCPQKSDPYHVRFIVGVNLIHYEGNVHTPTVDLTTAKILFNITISTPLSKFFGLDIINFYLITSMLDYEHMWDQYGPFQMISWKNTTSDQKSSTAVSLLISKMEFTALPKLVSLLT